MKAIFKNIITGSGVVSREDRYFALCNPTNGVQHVGQAREEYLGFVTPLCNTKAVLDVYSFNWAPTCGNCKRVLDSHNRKNTLTDVHLL